MIIIYDRGRKYRKLKIRRIQVILSAIDSESVASEESWDITYFNFIWHHNNSMIDTYE